MLILGNSSSTDHHFGNILVQQRLEMLLSEPANHVATP